MNRFDVISEVRALAPGVAQSWALAWRAVRFLERAAETARRSRLDTLDPFATYGIGNPVQFVAARCVAQVVKAPVRGEAAVAAALESAVDEARHVAAMLYGEYVARATKAAETVLNDPRRKAALRAGRSVRIVRAERFVATNGGAE